MSCGKLKVSFYQAQTQVVVASGLRLRRGSARTVVVVAEAVEAVGTQPFPRGAARTTVVVAEASPRASGGRRRAAGRKRRLALSVAPRTGIADMGGGGVV
jgi:hypothetical protein